MTDNVIDKHYRLTINHVLITVRKELSEELFLGAINTHFLKYERQEFRTLRQFKGCATARD